jgi:hypothetical protein
MVPSPLSPESLVADPTVVYAPASYPPHSDSKVYVVIAGALEYARDRSPQVKRKVDVRLLPLGLSDHFYRRFAWIRNPDRAGTFAAATVRNGFEEMDLGAACLQVRWVCDWPLFVREYFRSFGPAVGLWMSSFRRGRFNASDFLELRYRDIHLGDLAASEYLRFSKTGRSMLQAGLPLFRLLLESVFICKLALDALPVDSSTAVLALEPTYRHSVYMRALRSRGATVIEAKTYDSESFKFVPADEPLRHPYVAEFVNASLSPKNAAAVEEYMSARLADPRKFLPYMVDGYNRTDLMDIRGTDGRVPEFAIGKVHVVILLHSFDDAQYYFGNDGFRDLLDWTEFTLSGCLQNREIGSILIKAHPAHLAAGYYPKSIRTESWLERKYKHERIFWIDRQTSLRAIARVPTLYGITHHGSVAEELVYLKIPTIAFQHASWRNGYEFLRMWDDPISYGKLLASLTRETYTSVSDTEYESLMRFVKEFRLRPEAGDPDVLYSLKRWLRQRGEEHSGEEELHEYFSRISHSEAHSFLTFLAR